jgi:glutathione S-transferase
MKLYFHPLSSYSQKVVIASYEKQVKLTPVIVDMLDPSAKAAYFAIAPIGKVPLLVLDDGHKIPESSIIIEYLDTHFTSGTELIPNDKDLARRTRFEDRLSDSYLMEPLLKIFTDRFRPEGQHDAFGVEQARATLDRVYPLFDEAFAKKTWAVGDAFTMADCAYAPALAYLHQVHPFAAHRNLAAYFGRLVERPSFARVLDEAKPYLAKLDAAMGG